MYVHKNAFKVRQKLPATRFKGTENGMENARSAVVSAVFNHFGWGNWAHCPKHWEVRSDTGIADVTKCVIMSMTVFRYSIVELQRRSIPNGVKLDWMILQNILSFKNIPVEGYSESSCSSLCKFLFERNYWKDAANIRKIGMVKQYTKWNGVTSIVL